jgi:hypothetical protein
VTEIEQREFDSRTGRERSRVERKAHDGRARVIESQRDAQGREEKVETLINLGQGAPRASASDSSTMPHQSLALHFHSRHSNLCGNTFQLFACFMRRRGVEL